MSWLDDLFDWIRARWAKIRLRHAASRFAACLESEARDAFLDRLFWLMRLTLLADRRYRRSIEAYRATYVFQSQDRSVLAAVIFEDGRMRVQDRAIAKPDITVTFKDHQALANYLFNENQDLIGSIVDDEVAYVGNLNYLRKLAHMAKHLRLKFAPAP